MSPGAVADFDHALDLERLNICRYLARQNRELRHRGARETALRADTQTLHRREAGRLLNPAHEIVRGLQLRVLCTDDAEVSTLGCRQVTQRREISGAPRVV